MSALASSGAARGLAASIAARPVVSRVATAVVVAVVGGIVAFAGALGGLALPSSSDNGAAPVSGTTGVVIEPAVGDLSVAEIGAVAESAGFSGTGLVMAIAVALAESGGNPSATDFDGNGTIDRGVWQINSVHMQFSAACDYDPSCAAGAAFSISDGGTNWDAWVTYQHGAEIAFLPVAIAFVEGTNASPKRAPSNRRPHDPPRLGTSRPPR